MSSGEWEKNKVRGGGNQLGKRNCVALLRLLGKLLWLLPLLRLLSSSLLRSTAATAARSEYRATVEVHSGQLLTARAVECFHKAATSNFHLRIFQAHFSLRKEGTRKAFLRRNIDDKTMIERSDMCTKKASYFELLGAPFFFGQIQWTYHPAEPLSGAGGRNSPTQAQHVPRIQCDHLHIDPSPERYSV